MLETGAQGPNCTADTRAFNAVLYWLSYLGKWANGQMVAEEGIEPST